MPVTFVGHPLVDLVRPERDRDGFLAGIGLDPARPVVALLPGQPAQGDRAQPAARWRAPSRLLARRRPDLQFLAAVGPSIDPAHAAGAGSRRASRSSQGRTHAVLSAANVAVVASGTATVEAALLGTPMVVVYRLSALTYHLGRRFVKVPHVAMANLIAGQARRPGADPGRVHAGAGGGRGAAAPRAGRRRHARRPWRRSGGGWGPPGASGAGGGGGGRAPGRSKKR